MKIIEKLDDLYCDLVPWEWRPGQIWRRLTHRFWYRHSTIKPRYMGHGWANRDELMAHMMFEILSQFIEKECNPEIVEWHGEQPYMVTVAMPDGWVESRNVRDEMQDLYDWWRDVYHTEYQAVSDILWAEVEKHEPNYMPCEGGWLVYSSKRVWDSEESELIHANCMKALNHLDQLMLADLENRLQRVLNIRHHLST